VNVQAAPAWVAVKVRPPAVIVAVRALVVVLAATVKPMFAEPLPLAVPTPSQVALLDAVQPQPALDVSVNVPLPAALVKLWVAGDSAYAHGAAAWLTVKVCPPTVTVAVRAEVVVLAATVKPTLAEPLPLAVPTVTQVALLDAVQPQPAVDVRVIVPFPPALVKLWLVGVMA
jgi:hypothetical protein